jgi:peroxiredoxin
MYIHIGENKVLRKKDIAFVFDMDSSTVSVHTRNFLNKAQAKGKVISVSLDLPKSFIVTKEGTVYLSTYNTSTIVSRIGI